MMLALSLASLAIPARFHPQGWASRPKHSAFPTVAALAAALPVLPVLPVLAVAAAAVELAVVAVAVAVAVAEAVAATPVLAQVVMLL
jgi:hypothetical protein